MSSSTSVSASGCLQSPKHGASFTSKTKPVQHESSRERCVLSCHVSRISRRTGCTKRGGAVCAQYGEETETFRQSRRESDYDFPPSRDAPPPRPPGGGGYNNNNGGGGRGPGGGATPALVAAAFLVGTVAGVGLDTNLSFDADNVASRDIIDRQTPNSELCFAAGASAMVFDERIFVSLNPFNVYVAQPEVKPGCVLRRSNWSILETRELVTKEQELQCKKNLNTFAFVGDLEKAPEVSCVYHSEDAENQFMQDPRTAALGDGYQPRRSRDFK
eukprot:CAMPEP_0196588122 /NCGR_PEP_ID=MMETSP1081-20130531/59640_1 /TAXON_ID=36882 /ORGANISM="Pyramimonas amylifera, Strain CCMP720" /LENGTH=272 /DNA_ID=CAMNT_0041910533 /DNA_START=181 /DNA_END=999 /DNA_ORIENTATION=-